MLVFYDHFEQQINAVELERKGVALMLHRNQRNRENIRTAVEELLGSSKYRRNISALSESVSRYDSSKLAVEYIAAGFDYYIRHSRNP
jgi:UDP:flavonoid glycosyltransferase YjiC (YdhE family)